MIGHIASAKDDLQEWAKKIKSSGTLLFRQITGHQRMPPGKQDGGSDEDVEDGEDGELFSGHESVGGHNLCETSKMFHADYVGFWFHADYMGFWFHADSVGFRLSQTM